MEGLKIIKSHIEYNAVLQTQETYLKYHSAM